MSTEKLNPVYDILTIDSSSVPVNWSGFEFLVDSVKSGWIILWQYHAVFTGKIENSKIIWLESQPEASDKHLVRIRAFNKQVEYHFWRSSESIKGRLRVDGEGNGVEYVDTDMVLLGVVGKPLKEELRKGEMAVRTRNYIAYHSETYQAGYVDSRFVEFVKI